MTPRDRQEAKKSTAPPGLHQLGADLFVLVPPYPVGMLPFIVPELSRNANEKIITLSLEDALRRLAMRRPYLVAYWWMFPRLVGRSTWQRSLFEVVDRHWDYPGSHESIHLRRKSLSLARLTMKAADVTSAVSDALAHELDDGHGTVRVLPNAVDVDRVHRAVAGVEPRPRTAGYVGGLNERIDLPFLRQVIEDNSEWCFHLVGSGPLEVELIDLPNAEVHGDMPYDDALRILASCEVGIIPFRNDAYVRASNLLKPLDYLGAGIPCLATALPNLAPLQSEFPDWVKLSDSPSEWGRWLRSMARPRDGVLPDISRWDTRRRADRLRELLGASAGRQARGS